MWKKIASVGQLGQPISRVAQRPQPLQSPLFQPSAIPVNYIRDFRTMSGFQVDRRREYDHLQDFDRTVLNPERSEGTKSGTDSDVAKQHTAYDPTKTSPESEMQSSEEETQQEGGASNPLNVSGANKEVNEYRNEQEGTPENNAPRDAHSARGASLKHRKVNTTQGGRPQ